MEKEKNIEVISSYFTYANLLLFFNIIKNKINKYLN